MSEITSNKHDVLTCYLLKKNVAIIITTIIIIIIIITLNTNT